jgi:hypothetical protein
MANQELVKGALTRLGLVPSSVGSAGTRLEVSRTVSWRSPRFGSRAGRVLMSDGGKWVLVLSESRSTLTWVQEDLACQR